MATIITPIQVTYDTFIEIPARINLLERIKNRIRKHVVPPDVFCGPRTISNPIIEFAEDEIIPLVNIDFHFPNTIHYKMDLHFSDVIYYGVWTHESMKVQGRQYQCYVDHWQEI